MLRMALPVRDRLLVRRTLSAPPAAMSARPPEAMLREPRLILAVKIAAAAPTPPVLMLTMSSPMEGLMATGLVGSVSLTLMVSVPSLGLTVTLIFGAVPLISMMLAT